jgi:hypothetical protein
MRELSRRSDGLSKKRRHEKGRLMAKNRIQKQHTGKRPTAMVAVLCEEVTFSDGCFSLLRLFNETYAETQPGPENPMRTKGIFFAQLLSNGFVGVANVRIAVRDPAGDTLDVAKDVITFSKALACTTTKVEFGLGFGELGMHWFGLYVDDERCIEIPLNVMHKQPEPKRRF